MKTKKLQFLLMMAILLTISLLMFSCEKDNDAIAPKPATELAEKPVTLTPDNPDYFVGEIPPATIKFNPTSTSATPRTSATSSLTPEILNIATTAGVPFSEDKVATLSLPTIGDVMFHFDISGSMNGEIENVKVNSNSIFSNIKTEIDDLEAGVSYGERNYHLINDLALTTQESFGGALDDLPPLYGGLENYGLHFSKIANDLSWRADVAKVAIAFLDESPLQGYDGYTIGAGLAAIEAAEVTLIIVYSGGNNSYGNAWYQQWVDLQDDYDFELFRIPDTGIPPNNDINEFIIDAIKAAFCDVDKIELKAVDGAYQSWIKSVSPPFIENADVCETPNYDFNITFEVPNCTTPGLDSFEVGLYGDDVLYATQIVKVTVVPYGVGLDVHPGSCPNPLNTKSKGVTPVAILGAADFDVRNVDLDQITLNGVAPIRHNYEDVGTPEMPLIGKPLDRYACNTDGSDGYEDLTLKFRTADIIATLANPVKGNVYVLDLDAVLNNGMCIDGEDVIVISK